MLIQKISRILGFSLIAGSITSAADIFPAQSSPSLSKAWLRKSKHDAFLSQSINNANKKIFTDTLKYIEEHPLPPLAISVYPIDVSGAPLPKEHTLILTENATSFEMAQTLRMQGHKPNVTQKSVLSCRESSL